MISLRAATTACPSSISIHTQLANALSVLVITVFNAMGLVFAVVPMSAGVGFLLWVGVLITAQAFETDPSSRNHSWAVALGLVPCLASWALQLVTATGMFGERVGVTNRVPQFMRSTTERESEHAVFYTFIVSSRLRLHAYIVTLKTQEKLRPMRTCALTMSSLTNTCAAAAAIKIAHDQSKASTSMTTMYLTLPEVVSELEANGLHPYGMS